MEFYVHLSLVGLASVISGLFATRLAKWREIASMLLVGAICLWAGAFFPWSFTPLLIPGTDVGIRPSPFFLGEFLLGFSLTLVGVKVLRGLKSK